MLYTTANDRVNTYIATTVERAQYCQGYTVGWLQQHRRWTNPQFLRGYVAGICGRFTYKKVGGLHFIRAGRLGVSFFRSR